MNTSTAEWTLTPPFSSDRLTYTLSVSTSDEVISVVASYDTTFHSNAAMTIGTSGDHIAVELSQEDGKATGERDIDIYLGAGNIIYISLTASVVYDGHEVTYEVTVTRPQVPKLSALTTDPETLTFEADTLAYTISVSGNTDVLGVTADVDPETASTQLTVDGNSEVQSGETVNVALPEGSAYSILIVVTGLDGTTTTTYNLTVTRAMLPYLNDLDLNPGTLDQEFVRDTFSYTATAACGVSFTTVTATVGSISINTLLINGDLAQSGEGIVIQVAEGSNTVTVELGGDTGTVAYSLVLTVDPPPRLTDLTISEGTFTPSFESEVYAYYLTLGSSSSEINVYTTVDQEMGYTVQINGVVVGNDGSSPYGLAIPEGTNINTISAIDQANMLVTNYTLETLREYEAILTALLLTVGDGNDLLESQFDSANYNYYVEVAATVEQVSITATASPEGSSIQETETETSMTEGESSTYSVVEGMNTFVVKVTTASSYGGASATYSIEVKRNYLPKLESLTTSGTLSPAFDPFVQSYSVYLEEGVTTLTVTPSTATDSTDTITVETSTDDFVSIASTADVSSGDSVEVAVSLSTDTRVRVTGTEGYYDYVLRVSYLSPPMLSGYTAKDEFDITLSSTPDFEGEVASYTVSVPTDSDSACFTFSTESADYSLTVQGFGDGEGNTYVAYTAGEVVCRNDVPIGTSDVNVIVTDSNAATNGYTFTLSRQGRVYSSNITFVDTQLEPLFSEETLSYSVTVANDVDAITMTVTTESTLATMVCTLNSIEVVCTNGVAVLLEPLEVGDNTIKVKLWEDEDVVTTYIISAVRETKTSSSVSSLTSLEVVPDGGVNTLVYDSTVISYEVTVEPGVEHATVNFEVPSPATAAVVEGNAVVAEGVESYVLNLDTGNNLVYVRVTAEDGSQTDYMITVDRLSQSDMAPFFELQVATDDVVYAGTSSTTWTIEFREEEWTEENSGTEAGSLSSVSFQPHLTYSVGEEQVDGPGTPLTRVNSSGATDTVFTLDVTMAARYTVTVGVVDADEDETAWLTIDYQRVYEVKYGDMSMAMSNWSFPASVETGSSKFIIYGYDAYGNLVTGEDRSLTADEIVVQICPGSTQEGRSSVAECTDSSEVATETEQQDSGEYEVTFTITAGGDYSFKVWEKSSGAHIGANLGDFGDYPKVIAVKQVVVDASASKVVELCGFSDVVEMWSCAYDRETGKYDSYVVGDVPFGVKWYDTEGEPMSSGPLGTFVVDVQPADKMEWIEEGTQYIDNSDGTYTVGFKALETGTFTVTMTMDGEAVGGIAEYTVKVVVGEIAHHSQIESGDPWSNTPVVAGSAQQFTLVGYDSGSQRISVGGEADAITLSLSPTVDAWSPEVTDNGDGTYTISYSAPTVSDTEYALAVRVHNISINSQGSYTMEVSAAEIVLQDGAQEGVTLFTYLEATQVETVGMIEFTVHAYDRYGNPSSTGTVSGILGAPSGYTTYDTSTWSNPSTGRFDLEFEQGTTGAHNFTALLLLSESEGEGEIGFEEFTLDPSVPSTLSTYHELQSSADIGEWVIVYISAIDSYGNAIGITGQSDYFTLSVVGDTTGSGAAEVTTVVDQTGNPGHYNASFKGEYADTVVIKVLVSGAEVSQGSSTVMVADLPDTDAEYFMLSGETTGTAGEELVFQLKQTDTNKEFSSETEFVATLNPPSDSGRYSSALTVGSVDSQGIRLIRVSGEELQQTGSYEVVATLTGDAVTASPHAFSIEADATGQLNATIVAPSETKNIAAGTLVTCEVHLTDELGNVVTDWSESGLSVMYTSAYDGTLSRTLALSDDSTYIAASANLTRAGDEVTVTATVGGEEIKGSPIYLNTSTSVSSSSIDASVSLEGSAAYLPEEDSVEERTAGEPVTLNVVPYDEYGNRATGDIGMVVEVHITQTYHGSGETYNNTYQQNDGDDTYVCTPACTVLAYWDPETQTYQVTYTVTTAGSWNVELDVWAATSLEPETLTWEEEVHPGEVDPAQTVLLEAASHTAAETGVIRLELRDKYSNPVEDSSSADPVSLTLILETDDAVELTGSWPSGVGDMQVEDAVAEVSFEYLATVAGTYALDVLTAYVDSPLAASTVVVVPSTPDPEESAVLTETVPIACVAGQNSTFQLEVRDAFGNVVVTDAQPSVEMIFLSTDNSAVASGDTVADIEIEFGNSTGVYTVMYQIKYEGEVQVNVELQTEEGLVHIDESPFYHEIESSTTSASNSELQGDGLSACVVGYPATLRILAFDEYGNPSSSTTDAFYATIDGTRQEASFASKGVYEVSYTVTAEAETAILQVYLSSELITNGCPEVSTDGGGCIVTVVSSTEERAIDYRQTTASGDGLTNAVANGEVSQRRHLLQSDAADVMSYYSGKFVIATHDSDGVRLYEDLTAFTLQVDPGGSDDTYVVANEGDDAGTYTAYYARSTAGSYTLAVFQDEGGEGYQDISAQLGVSGNVTVWPNVTNAGQSSMTVLDSDSASTDNGVEVIIVARDVFGNEQVYSNRPSSHPYSASEDDFGGSASSEGLATVNVDAVLNVTSGEWEATLDLTELASYTITASFNGETVPPEEGQEEYTVEVHEGMLDPDATSMAGPGLSDAIVGSYTFDIYPRDDALNSLTYIADVGNVQCQMTLQNYKDDVQTSYKVTTDNEGNDCVPDDSCRSEDSSTECLFHVTYTVEHAGDYVLTVELCPPDVTECEITNSPQNLTFSPDSAAAAQTLPVPSPELQTQAAAGEKAEYLIQAYDQYGNRVTTGGASLAVTAQQLPDGADPGVYGDYVDHDDGTYTASITYPTGGADYFLSITMGGEHIGGSEELEDELHSPYLVSAGSARCSAEQSYMYGTAASAAEAGLEGVFYIEPLDQDGNPINVLRTDENFDVSMDPDDKPDDGFPRVEVVGTGEDTVYEVHYVIYNVSDIPTTIIVSLVTESGTYEGVGPDSGINSVTVSPGPPSANRTHFSDDISTTGETGVRHTLQIIAKDAWGNVAVEDPYANVVWGFSPEGDADGNWYISGPSEADEAYVATADGDAGEYRATWSNTVSGEYLLRVALNGEYIRVSSTGEQTFIQVVLSASSVTSDYSTWTAEGPGATSNATANAEQVMYIQARDAYGNAMSTGGMESSFSVSMELREGSLVDSTVTPVNTELEWVDYTKKYAVTFTALDIGTLTTYISVAGTAISGSPFVKEAEAGSAVASQSSVGGPAMSGVVVDEETYLEVTLKDAYGQQVQDSNQAARLSISFDHSSVRDNAAVSSEDDPGTYLFRFTLTSFDFGTSNLLEVAISYTDEEGVTSGVQNTPFYLNIYAAGGEVSSDECSAEGDGLVGAVAGAKASFDVTVKNAQGVVITPSDEWIAEPSKYVTFELRLQDTSDLKYQDTYSTTYVSDLNVFRCAYTATSSDLYTLEVIVDGTALPDKHVVQVYAATTSATHSILSISDRVWTEATPSLSTTVISGEYIIATVEPFDEYDNRQLYELYAYDTFVVSDQATADRGGTKATSVYSDPECASSPCRVWMYVNVTGEGVGTYEVAAVLLRDGAELSLEQTVTVTVTVGAVDFENTETTGEGLTSATVSEEASFRLSFKDSYGNAISINNETIKGRFELKPRSSSAVSSGEIQMAWQSSTSFNGLLAAYTLETTGTYDLTIILSAENQAEHTLVLEGYEGTEVLAGPVDTAKCVASGAGVVASTDLTAGDSYSFTVITKDSAGNLVTVGGALFSCLLAGDAQQDPTGVSTAVDSSAIVDNNDGEYTVTYQLTTVGHYLVQVSRNGQYIDGNNAGAYPVHVVAGGADASQCVVTGGGRSGSMAGVLAELFVEARDAFGNARQSTNDDFQYVIQVSTATRASGSFSSLGSGNYSAAYTVTTATEDLTVLVLLESEEVEKNTGGVVTPGSVSAANCYVVGSGFPEVSAGHYTEVKVTAKDEYNNTVPDSTLTFQLSVANSTGGQVAETTLAALPSEDGAYDGRVMVEAAGEYTMQVVLESSSTQQEVVYTAELRVTGGSADASTTSVQGVPPENESGAFSAYAVSSFTVEVRDEHGNLREVEDDLASLTIDQYSEATGDLVTLQGDEITTTTEKHSSGSGYIHTVEFTASVVGRMYVMLEYKDVEVRDTSQQLYTAELVAGEVSAGMSTYDGSGIDPGAIAGQQGTFAIQSNDAGGNPLTTELVGDDAFEVSVTFTLSDGTTVTESGTVVYIGGGAYEVTYQAPETATGVSIGVTLGGEAVGSELENPPDNPAETTVYPADTELTLSAANSEALQSSTPSEPATDATTTTTALVQAEGTAGAAFYFFVQLRSTEGLDMSSVPDGVSLIVEQAGAPVDITQSTIEGRFEVSVSGTKAGDVYLQLFLEESGTQESIKNGEIQFTVQAGEPDSSKSTVSGSGLTSAVAGEESTFEIYAKDAYDNDAVYDAVAGPASFTVHVVPQESSPESLRIRHLAQSESEYGVTVYGAVNAPQTVGSNVYQATYTAQTAGTSLVTVYLSGAEVAEASEAKVDNGAYESTNSILYPDVTTYEALWGTTLRCGDDYTLEVTGRDEYENIHLTPPLDFVLKLTPVTNDEASATTSTSTGTSSPYTISFRAYYAGTYQLQLSETSTGVSHPVTSTQTGQQYLTFDGGVVDPAHTVLQGTGVSSGVASATETVVFAVEQMDKYGNPVPANAEQAALTIEIDVVPLDHYMANGNLNITQTEQGGDYAWYNVSYLPYVPGTYLIDVKIDGVTAGDGTPVSVYFAGRTPPTITLVQFSDSLQTLEVSFSEETDHGGLTSEFSCSEVVDAVTLPLLGDDAVCAWGTTLEREFSYLNVFLGNGATINCKTDDSAADSFHIKDYVIRDEHQTSGFVTGSELVSAPENPVAAVAVLEIPPTVSVCDSAILDAGDSTGSGGRALKYEYTVENGADTTAIKTAFNEQNAHSNESSIYLASDDLTAGEDYVFTVRVTNYIGETSTAECFVTKETGPYPSVSILGANPLDVVPDRMLSLEGEGSQPNTGCVSGDMASQEMTYAWTQLEGPLIDFESDPDIALTMNTPILTISSGTLLYDNEYVFQLTAELVAYPGRYATDTITVVVGPSDIEIEGCLGEDYVGSYTSDVVLRADPLTDPMDAETTWNLQWACLAACAGGLDECRLYSEETFDRSCGLDAATQSILDSSLNEVQVVLPTGSLKPDLTYHFTVDVSKEPAADGRQKQDAVHIFVSEDAVILVQIPLESNTVVSTLAFQAQCIPDLSTLSFTRVLFQWHLVEGDDINGGGLESLLEEVYSFSCMVFEADDAGVFVENGLSGESLISIDVNAPPSGGRLTIKARLLDSEDQPLDVATGSYIDLNGDGVADEVIDGASIIEGGFQEMLVEFDVTALEWSDMNLPLEYEFFFHLGTEEDIAQSRQSSATATFSLPMGIVSEADTDGRYPMVYVSVKVIDAMGAESVYYYPHALAVREIADDNPVLASYFQEDAATQVRRRQRRLSQEEDDTSQKTSTARALKDLVFDPAVGSQSYSSASRFADLWGRSYGTYMTEYVMEGACTAVDEEFLSLKDEIVFGLQKLDNHTVLSESSIEQLICSVSKIAWKPGELGQDALDVLTTLVYQDKLAATTLRWYEVSAGVTNQERLYFGRAARCTYDLTNLMLRQVNVACNSETRTVDESIMQQLYKSSLTLAHQLAREQSVGAAEIKYNTGEYFYLAAARRKRLSSSSAETRVYDIEVRVTDEYDELMFGLNGNLLQVEDCGVSNNNNNITEDNGWACADDIGAEDLIDVGSLYYLGPVDENDTNYINPFPSDDPRAFGGIGMASAILEEMATEVPEDAPSEAMYVAYGQSLAIPLSANVSLTLYKLPDEYTDDYMTGVRFWNTTNYLNYDVELMQEPGYAYMPNTIYALGFSLYAEEKPPSPPPPPPEVLSPPEPIFGAPPPPPLMEKDELDMGIISGPVVAGIALCSYVIYVFARRRRLLQEIHMDYDDLIEKDEGMSMEE
ncbi:hypothetical protein CYMTET_6003 [Cymbomonas tetramitiformis]|uniref:Cadherin-like beta-sandwich-like domain-containing protein n=1 Tax=Cymbomonas tetramitiformis TaxID=36881 RepID=A0AAE0GY13_9CHLO|nr:hypothetical protein CYMTET_6003 [Cymbomonas tetramitiformis]